MGKFMSGLRRMKVSAVASGVCFATVLAATADAAPPGATTLVREAIELAVKKSGREVAEKVGRESVEQAVEAGVKKYGPRVAEAVADGGLELVEASAAYGDDVLRFAAEVSPAARRQLAIDPGNCVALARDFGPEAIELEAKSSGMAKKAFTAFGDDGAKQIAKTTPAEDVPRLVQYAENADSEQTRKLLLQSYKKEGASLFQRIPPDLVLSSGLSASMLYSAHRATAPFDAIGKRIAQDPYLAAGALAGLIGLLGLCAMSVLSSFGLTPWHGTVRTGKVKAVRKHNGRG